MRDAVHDHLHSERKFLKASALSYPKAMLLVYDHERAYETSSIFEEGMGANNDIEDAGCNSFDRAIF